MRMAAHLMDCGGHLFRVIDEVFNQRPLSTVLLWSKAMANVKTDGRTLWTTVTRQMLRESSAKEEELEGLVSFLAGVKTIKVAALLKERGDGTRVSLRSQPGVDVSVIARTFGGGGHPQAAGCTLPAIGEAAERLLLEAVEKVLGPVAQGSGIRDQGSGDGRC
jgi:phosphoesterase RecJ-like protein